MDVLQVTLVRWGIGGSIRDYFDIVLRAFSMQASVGLTIEVEILTLPWAKALGLSNLTVEKILLLSYLRSLIRKEIHRSLTIECVSYQMLSVSQVIPSLRFFVQPTKLQTSQLKKKLCLQPPLLVTCFPLECADFLLFVFLPPSKA